MKDLRTALAGIADWSVDHADAIARARKALGDIGQQPRNCSTAEALMRVLSVLPCDVQFKLAQRIAGNVGYELTPDTALATMEDRD